MLLDRRFDVNTELDSDLETYKRATPIHFSQSKAVTRVLLDRGAKATTETAGKGTAIMSLLNGTVTPGYSVHLVSPENIAALIEAGVDVKAKDKNGTTALHFAAGLYLHRVVAILLGKGALPNALNKSGHPPLYSLCSGGRRCQSSNDIRNRMATAQKLLEGGADVSLLTLGRGVFKKALRL